MCMPSAIMLIKYMQITCVVHTTYSNLSFDVVINGYSK